MIRRLQLSDKTWLRAVAIVAFVALMAPTDQALAAHFNLYFLAIGSSTYAAPTGPAEHGLDDIYGANNGAKAFAQRLRSGGAEFGVVLTSDEGHLVTLDDINSALQRVATVISATHATSPFLVVYFAGHGISEGIAWNHFSLPGTFTYRGRPEDLQVDELAKATLHAGSFADDLDKLRVPYMLILDTCYEGKRRDIESQVLTATAAKGLAATAQALRILNEFRQSNPVLFSTTPGNVVKVAPDPDDPRNRNVGPLARRAMLTLDGALRNDQELTLGAFVQKMVAADLDSATAPAVTHAEGAPFWNNSIAYRTGTLRPAEARLGTGTSAKACCEGGPVGTAQPALSGSSRYLVGGRIDLIGDAGEFVTAGRRVSLSGAKATLTLDQATPGNASIIADTGATSWEIELATPDGAAFTRRSYNDAQRAGFNEHGTPGLSVSGDSRGCNEVRGGFTVKDVAYDANGHLSRLSASVLQYCDDVRVPLRGDIMLEASSGRN